MVVDGLTLKLLRKDEKWVFPFVTYYQHGLGSPICLELLEYKEDSNGFKPEAVITVNLPGVERNAGCQFIDTNNNGEEILDWLILYGLCVPTGRYAVSGYCKYPGGGLLSERAVLAAKRALRQIFQLRRLTDTKEAAISVPAYSGTHGCFLLHLQFPPFL